MSQRIREITDFTGCGLKMNYYSFSISKVHLKHSSTFFMILTCFYGLASFVFVFDTSVNHVFVYDSISTVAVFSFNIVSCFGCWMGRKSIHQHKLLFDFFSLNPILVNVQVSNISIKNIRPDRKSYTSFPYQNKILSIIFNLIVHLLNINSEMFLSLWYFYLQMKMNIQKID